MKKTVGLWILIFFFCCNLSLFSQSIGKTYTNRLSGMKITNKLTGEVIKEKEMTNFINNHPNITFEPVIDKYGNIEAYVFDPSKTDGIKTRDKSKRVAKGELFPPFVMKSISNKIIDSEKLKGQPIVIQFQVSFNKPFFIEKIFNELDSCITNFRKTKIIEAILVTTDLKEEIQSNIKVNACSFTIVPDGRNFHDRYLITEFPSLILVDKEGKLVSYYNSGDLTKLKSDLTVLE